MNQVFCLAEAHGDRQGSTEPGRKLLGGLALLLAMMGAASCGGDPVTGEDEAIDDVSQAWGPEGGNGITPGILATGYLQDTYTFAAGINSPADQRPINLCGVFKYNALTNQWICDLKQEWSKWLYVSGGVNVPATVDRYQLLRAMVDCSMPPTVIVNVPGFPSEDGMFGLYMQWATKRLEMHERQVLSACVGAKVNAFGAVVPIGFVGPDVPQPINDASFLYQEAAFFGDLFGQKPLLMACSGKKDGGGSYIVGKNLRVCGQLGNPCHIRALGACDAGTFVCGAWKDSGAVPGLGASEYCDFAHDGIGHKFLHPLTVYLQTEPALLSGDVTRCGLKGDQLCDDKAPL